MAGVIATIPKFQFSANGVPMVGGTLDTYIAGSTTPATTWQDSALTIANTNPISLDARGECVLWLDPAVVYKFVLKNAQGVIQWTQDNISNPAALANSLRADLAASSGASLVGGGAQVVSSIAALRALLKTSPSSKAFVTGYYADGDGGGGQYYYDAADTTSADDGGTVIVAADGGRWKLSFTDWLSVKQFGAMGDGVTNDAEYVNKAIALTKDGRPLMLVYPPSLAGYKQTTPVLVPSNVSIDLGNNNIIGSGGTGFETATWVSGVLTTNIGTAPESTLVRNTHIRNGRMTGFLKAFNLQNLIWNSSVTDIEFVDGGWSIYAIRCFYSAFQRLNTNGLLVGHMGAAYKFDGVNNVLELTALSTGGGTLRQIGFDLNGSAPDCNLTFINCTAENVVAGMVFTGALNSLSIRGCYFENISDTAINLSGSFNKYGIDIDNNWFYNVATAVIGRFCLSGRWGRNNQLYTDGLHPTAAVVDLYDEYATQMVVEIPNTLVFGAAPATLVLPPNYLIGPGCKVDYIKSIVNSAGSAVSNQGITSTQPIPFHYAGTGGTPDAGVIPFCTFTVPAGTSGNVVVDTKIPFDSPDLVGFSLQVVDTNGVWRMGGLITGGGFLVNANPGGRAVAVSNNAGFIRITISGFISSTSVYQVSGVIRLL